MKRIDCVLAGLMAVSALVVCGGVPTMAADETVKITVDTGTPGMRIAPDFIGFGYETSAVAQANYFGGKNARLIQLYRNLSAHGLIRIGGCASDNTQYVPDGTPVVRDFKYTSIINKQNLSDLGDFARAAGWKVMWGLNLGAGTKEQAVQEALAVDAVLGSQLQSFQVGNEVENLPEVKSKYPAFHAAYLDFKSGIRAVLPNAPFSGPDSVGHWDFITSFAADESHDMKLLTQHYYCSDAHDPKASIEKMLTHDAKFEQRLEKLQQLCQANGLSYRINEVNSFSSGGKPGVSDTFASALWCLDFMFQLASHGCGGINVETDVNQHAWISHYSPIVHDEAGVCTARPDYYGMLAFAMAGSGDVLKLNLEESDINLSAYATLDSQGSVWVTVVNKDLANDAGVEINMPAGFATAEAYRLVAPAFDSKSLVTFAGAEVSADGKWAAGAAEPVGFKAGVARVSVPHASAAVLRFMK